MDYPGLRAQSLVHTNDSKHGDTLLYCDLLLNLQEMGILLCGE